MNRPPKPDIIYCGPVFYAMFRATIAFSGRDRRRIKREQNKAARRARIEARR